MVRDVTKTLPAEFMGLGGERGAGRARFTGALSRAARRPPDALTSAPKPCVMYKPVHHRRVRQAHGLPVPRAGGPSGPLLHRQRAPHSQRAWLPHQARRVPPGPQRPVPVPHLP